MLLNELINEHNHSKMKLVYGFLILASLFSTGTSNYQGNALFALKNSLKTTPLSDCEFQGNNITGKIPEQLGNLTNLAVLIMENNSLTGEIPTSFGNLTKFQILSLSQNNLSGNTPDSISYLPHLDEILLTTVSVAWYLIDYFKFANKIIVHKARKPVVLGSIGGGIGSLFVGCVVFLLWKRMYKDKREDFVDIAGEDVRIISFGQLKRFSWLELEVATDHFNEENVLGQGGFGNVYKGVLLDNTEIEVKRITDNESPGSEATFPCEIEMISVESSKADRVLYNTICTI